ncbi:MAG: hypothetical protein A2X94_01250 [Bdellovibrionales bacterium GWB1_55_8]|nr:MAG: hypothetical protein A2X94_01250 [Bdellovibrionales bacterium GWB1_55_8]
MSAKESTVALLARRFLLSKASDGFLSFIAWVSVAGVALGVLALTVVTSVINGFEGELTRVITGMNGDVILYSREPVGDSESVMSRIRELVPTRGITPSFVAELMVSGPEGVAGAVLEGIDPATVSKVTAVGERIVSGKLPAAYGEIVLGSALADKIGASVGSELRLIIPFTGGNEAGFSGFDEAGVSNVVTGRVVGIVKMGMHEYDSKLVLATLAEVQRSLKQPGRVTSFKIRLAPRQESRMASDRLADAFGYPFRAKDWSQLNRNLFYAIRLEKVVIAIILTAIIIVAAFNVVSTLMMMIHDKTREIAILKAMGLRKGQSFRLFCLIGGGMGFVGTGVGVGLGLLINLVIDKTRLIDLPPEIYYIGFLPVVERWSEIGLIAVVAIVISLLAAIYPAWSVSRKSPLDGLRHE